MTRAIIPALALFLCACTEPVCKVAGRTFRPGDSFQFDCNTCVCGHDGLACTENDCGPPASPLPTVGPAPRPSPPPSQPPLIQPPPSSSVRAFTLPIQRPWTDTGIEVEVGQHICIEVRGDVIYADPPHEHHAGPSGTKNPPGGCSYLVTDDAVPAQSVVANIAPRSVLDGKGFFVGSRFAGPIPSGKTTASAGHLWLGFNDGAVRCDRTDWDKWGFGGDNRGQFEVTIHLDCAQQ